MSRRARLALVIALLAFLPNLVLALTLGALGEGPWPPLLLWLFLLALLSGLVGYFLAKSLLRPLEELTRALAYLSLKEGPLEALRLPTPKEPPPEEIALLRARFSELLARLEARPPRGETLNLRALAEDLLLRYRDEAKRRGLLLEVEGAGLARGERLLVERALANLLENALRHAKSRVRLRVGEGVFLVEDDGEGLPLPLEALARPFLQGEGRRGSAGLGLYTAKRVAEAHGGRLFPCEGPLGGACLGLELPKA